MEVNMQLRACPRTPNLKNWNVYGQLSVADILNL
jgi:hypothetical protein